jgi:hypothetical protein
MKKKFFIFWYFFNSCAKIENNDAKMRGNQYSLRNQSYPIIEKLSVEELYSRYNDKDNYDPTKVRELITKPESFKLWPLDENCYIQTVLSDPKKISECIENIRLVEAKYSPVSASWLIPFLKVLMMKIHTV